MMNDLTGKRVIVVGSANNITQEIAHKILACNGELIFVTDSAEKSFKSSTNFKYHYNIDLSDSENFGELFAEILETHYPFDGFVFCLNKSTLRPLSATKYKTLEELMRTNFFAFIEITRIITTKHAFIDGGSIVAISSVSSIRGLKGKLAYSASKAALDSSVKCLAAELGGRRIRVNTIQKGWMDEDFSNPIVKDGLSLNVKGDLERQILGPIKLDELGSLVSFLLSDSAKSITGTNILLDGGHSL